MADRLKLSWETIHDGVEALSMMAGKPKLIVGVSRGGLIPATLLSHKLGVPLEVVSCSAYEGTRRTLQKPLVVEGWKERYNSNDVLIVDDILDTGDTYTHLLETARNTSGHSNFKFATLVNKQCERFGGFKTYFIQVPRTTWIQFPWEDIDAPF